MHTPTYMRFSTIAHIRAQIRSAHLRLDVLGRAISLHVRASREHNFSRFVEHAVCS
jgi:hypothetical protein